MNNHPIKPVRTPKQMAELNKNYQDSVEKGSHHDWIIRHQIYKQGSGEQVPKYFRIGYYKATPGNFDKVTKFYKKHLEPVYDKLLDDGDVLAAGSLSVLGLLAIPRRRRAARDDLRLDVGDSYTSFTQLESDTLALVLSALGIMIGIGAMVAVLGLSESSKSDLIAQLDRLGTNMLQVQAGTGIGLGSGELPDTSTAMVGRIGPVETVAAVSDVNTARVYKNDLIPSGQTGGITVQAVDVNLLETLGG